MLLQCYGFLIVPRPSTDMFTAVSKLVHGRRQTCSRPSATYYLYSLHYKSKPPDFKLVTYKSGECVFFVVYSLSKSSNGNPLLNLSKSDWNNLSCITRYFSNSVSANSLAYSADTIPASGKTASPPASAQSSLHR